MEKTRKMLQLEERLNEPIENWLKRRYSDENKGSILISTETKNNYGVSVDSSTLLDWLRIFGIRIKTLSEAQLRGKKLPSGKKLDYLHWKADKTIQAIAKKYSVNYGTIYALFDRCSISRKTVSEARLKGRIKPSDEELYKLRFVEKKTYREIGKQYDFPPITILRWIKNIDRDNYKIKVLQFREIENWAAQYGVWTK